MSIEFILGGDQPITEAIIKISTEYGTDDNGRNILLLLTQSSILVNLDLYIEAKYDSEGGKYDLPQ